VLPKEKKSTRLHQNKHCYVSIDPIKKIKKARQTFSRNQDIIFLKHTSDYFQIIYSVTRKQSN
jgi:hypothetical protein